MKLIREKMTIPEEFPHLVRARLMEALSSSLQNYGATVIAGRAGTGKTTLAASFARKCGWPVAWYKVDAPDGELRWFLRYLAASVAEQNPEMDLQKLLEMVEHRADHDITSLAELFAGELQKSTRPLLLVIDDLHLIYDAHWLTPFFHRLLMLLPKETHLLIVTRSIPPAPLWRLRSKQQLFVLTETDLAFTPSEAQDLFADFGLASARVGVALEQSHGRASTLTAIARRERLADVTL